MRWDCLYGGIISFGIKVGILILLFFCPFLASEERVAKIVTTSEPPTNYVSVDGEITGTSTDIISEIRRKLNLTLPIEVLPWSRAYAYVKLGRNVVAFTAGKTPERVKHGFHFIGPVFTRKHVLYKKRSRDFRIDNIQDIKVQKLRVGAMRSDWRSLYLASLEVDVKEVNEHLQNIHKLLSGRIDLWVTSDIEALTLIKSTPYALSDLEQVYVIKEGASYIILSEDTSEVILNRWRQAFSEIQASGFLQQTAEKWSDRLQVNLQYTDDKGFYMP